MIIDCQFHCSATIVVTKLSWLHFTLPKTFFYFTKSLSLKRTSYLTYNSSRICYETNWPIKDFIKSALVLCIWDYRSYKNQTQKPKQSKLESYREDRRRLTKYPITRSYFMCWQLSILSGLIGITMTLLQIILKSIKPSYSLARNTIGWA